MNTARLFPVAEHPDRSGEEEAQGAADAKPDARERLWHWLAIAVLFVCWWIEASV
jgi:hypothetical protein